MLRREMINHLTRLMPHEEIANTATHGLGLLLSLLGTVEIMTVVHTIEDRLAIGCSVYAVTLVTVYTVSTLSHSVQKPRPKHLLRAWDQGVIYFLIAGTYTPFVCMYLSSYVLWLVLSGIWTYALIGCLSKVVVQHRVIDFKAHSYVILGWLPALTMLHCVSPICLKWMALGGLLYTVGILFLFFDHKVRFFHATWHLFVVAGSVCHYYAVMAFVVFQ